MQWSSNLRVNIKRAFHAGFVATAVGNSVTADFKIKKRKKHLAFSTCPSAKISKTAHSQVPDTIAMYFPENIFGVQGVSKITTDEGSSCV